MDTPSRITSAKVRRPVSRRSEILERACCGRAEQWRLYNLRDDPRELQNLTKAQPGKFAELKSEWGAYAAAVGYIEASEVKQLTEMSAEEFFRFTGVE